MFGIFINALYRSAIGFSIVFLTLVVLVLIVKLAKWLDKEWEARELKQSEAKLTKEQNIDYTTLVLISAAVATYYKGRARIRRVRVLPTGARSGSWANQARSVLQSSHTTKR